MKWLTRLFWLAIALLAFLFAVLAVNQSPIALEFLAWRTPEISVFWWLFAAFVLGLLLGIAGITLSSMKVGLRNRRLAKELDERDKELHRLRNLTLHE